MGDTTLTAALHAALGTNTAVTRLAPKFEDELTAFQIGVPTHALTHPTPLSISLPTFSDNAIADKLHSTKTFLSEYPSTHRWGKLIEKPYQL